MPHTPQDRLLPLAVGGALVALGLAMRGREPQLLSLPEPRPLNDASAGPLVEAAHKVRDTIHSAVPGNLATTLARSMVITGAAMILVRALDEATAAAARR